MLLQILLQVSQDIERQAREAGNQAFQNAMIRNILIIVGVAVVYFIIKSSGGKKDETKPKS